MENEKLTLDLVRRVVAALKANRSEENYIVLPSVDLAKKILNGTITDQILGALPEKGDAS